MGLFGRKKDAEGFYTGDAPVIAPGFDGADPGAYVPPDYRPPTTASPAAHPTDAAAAQMAASSTMPQGAAPGPFPGAPFDSQAANLAAQSGPATGAAGPAYQFGSTGQPGALDPATAARVQAALAGVGRKTSKIGCLLIAIPVIGALVGVGFAVYSGVSATKGVSAAVSEALEGIGGQVGATGGAVDGRHEGTTKLGEPVSIRTTDAAYTITVFGAVSQPGDAWGYARAGSDPMLVVDAQITRTDTGAEPIEFTGWNWSVTDRAGRAVSGDIITNFEPSLDGPELVGGQSARGYVTFRTAVTDTALAVAGGPIGPALAVWQISAASPKVVTGEIGKPALAEISRPGFTVTIGEPEVLLKGDERVGHVPEAGQYLVLPLTFTGVDGTSGSLGNVDSEAFVFKPDGAPAMFSEFSGVDGASSFYPVNAATPTTGFLAFDTVATSGTLQLRDGGDRTLITWQITVGG